jgi:NTP pyrophosphatase (non-canonical NTP hydrolase)
MSKADSRPVEPPTLFAVQARAALADSERWFPEVAHSVVHHALSLTGEAGEFANLIKKIERGSLDINDPSVRMRLMMELTDTYIYLLNLAGLLNFDLSKAYDMARAQNEKRFTAERTEREAILNKRRENQHVLTD